MRLLIDYCRTANRLRWLLLFAALSLPGCQNMNVPSWTVPAPGGQPANVAEPPLAMTVPLAPGEVLLQPAGCPPGYNANGQPMYLPPGVAPPVGSPNAIGGIPGYPQGVAPPQEPPAAVPGWLDVLPQAGGAISPDFGLPAAPVVTNRVPNPLVVPVANQEYAWDQISDVVSDYFPIVREQRVQLTDGIMSEGIIETPYQIGATLLEGQRWDSVGSFNRWQSTLQTIRRKAILNITPTAQGYAIGTQVFKQLEDLPQPENSSAGAATLRSDNSLPSDRRVRGKIAQITRERESLNWINLGRDEVLEQEILKKIQERLTGAGR